jgi:hypothetical protein
MVTAMLAGNSPVTGCCLSRMSASISSKYAFSVVRSRVVSMSLERYNEPREQRKAQAVSERLDPLPRARSAPQQRAPEVILHGGVL